MMKDLSLDDLDHANGGIWQLGAGMFGSYLGDQMFSNTIPNDAQEQAMRAPQEQSGFANQADYQNYQNDPGSAMYPTGDGDAY